MMRWPRLKRKQRADFTAPADLAALTDLQRRCVAQLSRDIPAEIDYVPDSITELWMKYFVADIAFDEEMIELLVICALEAENSVESMKTMEAREYFREDSEILNAMLVQLTRGPERTQDTSH